MSLMNDALQDLQARESLRGAEADGRTQGFILKTADDSFPQNSHIRFNIFMVVLVLVTLAGFILSDNDKDALTPAATGQITQTEVSTAGLASAQKPALSQAVESIPTPAAARVKPGNVADASAPMAEVKPTVTATQVQGQQAQDAQTKSNQDKSNQEKLQAYLADGQQALADNRLTLPKNHNAIHYFSQALQLDETNASALQGLQAVKHQYLSHIENALNREQTSRANRLIERMALAGFDVRQQQNYRQKLNEAKALQVVENAGERPAAEQSLPTVADREASEASERTTKNSDRPAIEPSLTTRDTQTLHKAKSLIDKGQTTQAISLLQNFFDDYPQSIQSPVFLFEQRLAAGEITEAQAMIARMPKDHPAKPYLKAQLNNAVYGSAPAIAQLENNVPHAQIEKAHYSLLAALYQKEKQFDKAREAYSHLVQKYPTEVTYVLGLAVSADSLDRKQEAFRAYRRVAELGHPNRNIRAFVEKRLLNLRSETMAGAGRW